MKTSVKSKMYWRASCIAIATETNDTNPKIAVLV